MAWEVAIGELVKVAISEHPDVVVLSLIAVGAYYELHYGTIKEIADRQHTLSTAVHLLLAESEYDEERFRDDMWNGDESRPYPSDYRDESRQDDD